MLLVGDSMGGDWRRNLMKRCLWWAWQMCLAVLVRTIVNTLDAHLSFALDLVKASWLGFMMESVFRNQQRHSTSPFVNVSTNAYVNVHFLPDV